jgi:capsular exopolysaccharide synthesis family protein
LHKPKIHKVFKLQNVAGLSSYLIGKTNYTDTIYHSQVENLDVITAGPVPPNASELVLNEKVDAMLADAKTRYDYIIIDTPPIMLISDSLVLMEKADLSLFVFNTAKATKAGVKHLEEVLSLNKQSKAAVVLNNTKISRWKYYYGKYAYKYGYGYGYGYGSYGSGAYGSNDYMEDSSRTKRKS